MIKKLATFMFTALLALIVGFNIWGAATQGSMEPMLNAEIDENANSVVMVFGATGSAGGGLLKAAMEDNEVKKVYVVSRRTTPYIDTTVATGKATLIMQKDFTDYSQISNELREVSTVLWGWEHPPYRSMRKLTP